MFRWFSRYARRYMSRHFNGVRVARGSWPQIPSDEPAIFYANHPSWWDPLLALVLNARLGDGRSFYAPIDADMLRKYAFFEKLGFFGVGQDDRRGAMAFMRTALSIVDEPGSNLWITAQGRFADPRERPLALRPGLAHLAARMKRGMIIPVAGEVCFWNERRPEALVRFGEPIRVESNDERDADDWQCLLTDALESTMDRLAPAVVARRPSAFDLILEGRTGVSWFYDAWRKLCARLRGERFDPRHERSKADLHA